MTPRKHNHPASPLRACTTSMPSTRRSVSLPATLVASKVRAVSRLFGHDHHWYTPRRPPVPATVQAAVSRPTTKCATRT